MRGKTVPVVRDFAYHTVSLIGPLLLQRFAPGDHHRRWPSTAHSDSPINFAPWRCDLCTQTTAAMGMVEDLYDQAATGVTWLGHQSPDVFAVHVGRRPGQDNADTGLEWCGGRMEHVEVHQTHEVRNALYDQSHAIEPDAESPPHSVGIRQVDDSSRMYLGVHCSV